MASTPESLLEQGYHARLACRLDEARALYAEAVDWCRKNNDAPMLARSLARVGAIDRDLREIDRSLQRYQEAVAIYRTLDAPLNLAHTIRHVGDILRESGRMVPALPCYEEALSIYRCHSGTDALDLANTLRGYALLKSALGESETAKSIWQEAGSLYAQVDVQAGVEESQRQIAELTAT
jgi:tetratricopeptide (TPR) repeat protein